MNICLAPVTGSPVSYRGGFMPDHSCPGGFGAPPCYTIFSVLMTQYGVCWHTAAAFHYFAIVPSIPIRDGCQLSKLVIFPTSVGGPSGTTNISFPSIPVRDGRPYVAFITITPCCWWPIWSSQVLLAPSPRRGWLPLWRLRNVPHWCCFSIRRSPFILTLYPHMGWLPTWRLRLCLH